MPRRAQLVQGKLADMYTTAAAARSLVHATARAADAGSAGARRLRRDCAAAILFAAEAATRVALDGIQVLGGNGYINECGPTTLCFLIAAGVLGEPGSHSSASSLLIVTCIVRSMHGNQVMDLMPVMVDFMLRSNKLVWCRYPTGRLLRDAKLYEIGAGTCVPQPES